MATNSSKRDMRMKTFAILFAANVIQSLGKFVMDFVQRGSLLVDADPQHARPGQFGKGSQLREAKVERRVSRGYLAHVLANLRDPVVADIAEKINGQVHQLRFDPAVLGPVTRQSSGQLSEAAAVFRW